MGVAGDPAGASARRRDAAACCIEAVDETAAGLGSDGSVMAASDGPLVEIGHSCCPQLLGPVAVGSPASDRLARFGDARPAAGHPAGASFQDRRSRGAVRRLRGSRNAVADPPAHLGVRLDAGRIGTRRRLAGRGRRFSSRRRCPGGTTARAGRRGPDRHRPCCRSPICHRIAWRCSTRTRRSSLRSPATRCRPDIGSVCAGFITDPGPSRSTTPSTRRFRGSNEAVPSRRHRFT